MGDRKGKPLPRYTRAFRLSALRRVREDGETKTEVCRSLGIATGTMDRWDKQYAPGTEKRVGKEKVAFERASERELEKRCAGLEKRCADLEKELEGSASGLLLQVAERDLRIEELELLIRAREEAESDGDSDGGVVTAVRMRKVMSQSPVMDAGPLEPSLRAWWERDPKGYLGAVDERERAERGDAETAGEVKRLRAENAELRAVASVSERKGVSADVDDSEAMELIEKILAGAA